MTISDPAGYSPLVHSALPAVLADYFALPTTSVTSHRGAARIANRPAPRRPAPPSQSPAGPGVLPCTALHCARTSWAHTQLMECISLRTAFVDT